jgi:hypothetical protein
MKAGEIASKAAEIVEGSRQQTHGQKERSFETIAKFWTTYLTQCSIGSVHVLDAEDVAHMMVLLKMARAIEGLSEPDHWVDMCGYAALAGELATSGNPNS